MQWSGGGEGARITTEILQKKWYEKFNKNDLNIPHSSVLWLILTLHSVFNISDFSIWWHMLKCISQISYFDTRYLVFYNPSPPRMFLSLDLLSEYRIQHGAIGPLYVTSSYSTWIFCRGVSGFATGCPCDVWFCGLTTCLLHVSPPFGNRFVNTGWAVGLTYWIVYLHFFCILAYAIIYVLIHHIIFGFIFSS